MKVATIISYCTHDYRFLGKCIEEAQKFSEQVVIPVCDHFYDGTPENRFLLERTYANHPDCEFIEFTYDPERLYSPYLSYTNRDPEWPHLWHATARYIGFLYLNESIDYVLFLDCDEIMEGKRFANWLQNEESWKNFNAMRLGCYYYVLRPTWRAEIPQALSLFAKRDAFHSVHFIHPSERYALFQALNGPKLKLVYDQTPFVHHYSWVRTQEENLHKGKTWGHQKDCDWNAIIRSSFAGKKIQEFFGGDFEFEEIQNPYFDPLAISVPEGKASGIKESHVRYVNHRLIQQKEFDAIEARTGG